MDAAEHPPKISQDEFDTFERVVRKIVREELELLGVNAATISDTAKTAAATVFADMLPALAERLVRRITKMLSRHRDDDSGESWKRGPRDDDE
ncbi:MAG TPA: hypothetical protein VGI99_02210 [Gemmataceae bacterium]